MRHDLTLFRELVLELRRTPPLGLTLDLFALWRQGPQFLPRSLAPIERPLHRLHLRIQHDVTARLLRTSAFLTNHRLLLSLPQQIQFDCHANYSDSSYTTDGGNTATIEAYTHQDADGYHPRNERDSASMSGSRLSLQDRAVIFLTASLFRTISSKLLDPFPTPPLFPEQALDQQCATLTTDETADESLSLAIENSNDFWDASNGEYSSLANVPIWCSDPPSAIREWEIEIDSPGWMDLHLRSLLDAWSSLDIDAWISPYCRTILLYFPQLSYPLQRLQWQQLQEATAQIPVSKHLRQLLRFRDVGHREALASSRGRSPQGGLCGISRQGDLDSLLPSELLFWQERARVNPFLVRWLNAETLFFQREQAHAFIYERQICFYLDLDPGEIKYKASGVDLPGHCLIFGLIANLAQHLQLICPKDRLEVNIILEPTTHWQSYTPLLQLFFQQIPHSGSNLRLKLLQLESSKHHAAVTSKMHRADIQMQPACAAHTGPSNPLQRSFCIYIATPTRWPRQAAISTVSDWLEIAHTSRRSDTSSVVQRTLDTHRAEFAYHTIQSQCWQLGLLVAPVCDNIVISGNRAHFGRKPDDANQPDTNTSSEQTKTNDRDCHSTARQPDIFFALEDTSRSLTELAALRDRMLSAILQTPFAQGVFPYEQTLPHPRKGSDIR
jgi:hypothetical protein